MQYIIKRLAITQLAVPTIACVEVSFSWVPLPPHTVYSSATKDTHTTSGVSAANAKIPIHFETLWFLLPATPTPFLLSNSLVLWCLIALLFILSSSHIIFAISTTNPSSLCSAADYQSPPLPILMLLSMAYLEKVNLMVLIPCVGILLLNTTASFPHRSLSLSIHRSSSVLGTHRESWVYNCQPFEYYWSWDPIIPSLLIFLIPCKHPQCFKMTICWKMLSIF